MSDFDTEAQLSLVVPQSELRNVRQQIQSEIGATQIGMTDGGSMSAQTAGGGAGGGRARRRARRSYRMEITRTDLLDDAVTYLESIEDHVSEGGPGGGSIANEILNFAVDTGGDAGGAAALGGAATALGGAATALGGAAAALTGAAGVLAGVGGGTISVERPNWVPLQVEDPGTVEFETLPGPVQIEEPGTPYPLETPPSPYPVEEPSQPYPVEPVDEIPVEDVGPIDVEVTVRTREGSGETNVSTEKRRGNESPREWLERRISEGLDYIDPTEDGSSESRQQSGSSDQGSSTATVQTESRGVSVSDESTTRVVVETDSGSLADEVTNALERQFDQRLNTIESDLQDLEGELDRVTDSIRRSR